jgi:uncharacterized protein YndB with AHSA1/START domain
MASRTLEFENRFKAPAKYVHEWLTDFRPDDGERWFGDAGKNKVERQGNAITIEGSTPIGPFRTVVTVESVHRWTAQGEILRGGKPAMRTRVVETLHEEGDATVHRVQLTVEPLTLLMRLMGPIAAPMMRSRLAKGFRKMEAEVERAHKASQPPTA